MSRVLQITIVIAGLALLYPMQRWKDSVYPKHPISEESLYLSSGTTLKKASLGLHGLLADVYWIRTVQYFGHKIDQNWQGGKMPDTRAIRMDLLAPFLNIIVTLDPQSIQTYRFGAMFLPERDFAAAVSLLEKGVESNPAQWRLYQDLGYIYWQAGDYEKAGAWFERGSQIEGALWWMRDMAGLMRIKGGSRETAREMYLRYLESDDKNIRAQAANRLNQLQAYDEVDALNMFLQKYRERTGACPPSFRPFASQLRAAGFQVNNEGAPVDPAGFPYDFNPNQCKVAVSGYSTIPL